MNETSTAIVLPPESLPAALPAPQAGTIARQEFGASQVQVIGETAVTAAAATVKAEIEAAYVMAMQRPRNPDLVYERIMRDCQRPSFAGAAMYRLPRGGKTITGLSVRFVEAALRAMGNVVVKAHVLYDDENRQMVQVVGVDLETNARFEDTVIIEKTVERRVVKDGQRVLGSRRNSSGEVVYLVPATEDDLRMKRGAEVSRARRNIGMQLVPGDVIEDAKRQIVKTQMDKAAKDPDAERKALILGFSEIGVSPEQLTEYLGHGLERSQPAELVDLRQLWRAISDGQTTWRSAMEAKAAEAAQKAAEEAKAEAGKAEIKGGAAARLKDRVAGAKSSPAAPAQEREPGDDSDELGLK